MSQLPWSPCREQTCGAGLGRSKEDELGCQRGGLRPVLEASGLLRATSLPDGRRRPADVLVCSAACLAERSPDGSLLVGRRVALDFALINAVGPGHWQKTFDVPGSAEVAYADRKCRHQNTEARCAEAGLVFKPMVMTAQGTMTPAMGAILHKIAEAVATVEGLEPSGVKQDMMERLAIHIARSNARAITRRRAALAAGASTSAAQRTLAASVLLEEPPEDSG